MNQILSRAIKSAFWKLLLFGSNFGLNIVLANNYGAAGSAPIFYLLNNLALATLLLGFGLENSFVYFYSKQLTSKKNLLLTALGWSIGATLLFATFNTSFGFINADINGLSLWFSYVYVFGALLNNLVAALFYADHQNKFPNLIPGVLNLSFLTLLFFSANSKEKIPSYEYIQILFLLPLLSSITLFVLQFFRFTGHQATHKLPIKRFLLYSFLVYLAALSMGMFNRIDIWIIEAQCTSEQLGNYIQVSKFGQVALLIPLLASFSLFPSFVQNMEHKQELAQTVYKVANLYFYLVTFFCIIANLVSTWVLPWMYGKSFYLMPSLLLLISPGIIAFATAYPFISFFGAGNKNTLLARMAIESTILLVAADLVLIPFLEIAGAALGYSMANLFFVIRAFTAFQKSNPSSITHVFAPQNFTLNLRMLIKSLKLQS